METQQQKDVTYPQQANIPAQLFYFIRHGETDWNREQRTQGSTDTHLNATGIQQVHDAVELLRALPIKTIAYSPLSRAWQTATIIAAALHVEAVEIEELKEVCFGIYEGRSISGERLEQWRNGDPIEGGESYTVFTARIIKGMQRALSLPGPVLIVSHGGVHSRIQRLHGLIPHPAGRRNCIPFLHEPLISADAPAQPECDQGPHWRLLPLDER